MYDVIIIGAGSAGYTAGIYATRFGMKTLLLGTEPGGQTNEAFEIDNYPGLLNITGLELMKKFREQAEKLGAEVAFMDEVLSIDKKGDGFLVKTKGKEYETKTVILATGSKKRKLGVPGEEELKGRGVAYCATCDAMFYKDRTVVVIGGGDSAVKSAILLTEHASKVYLAYRKGKENLRSMPSWLKRLDKNEKVEKMFFAAPKKINGKEKVESITFDQ
ncbi:MAG: FAD-dependent oxidoreductase, partial [Candidatus Aenigmarchaeota archaeon]|nr:FAD-dependent oxidoreductase [Candidatus Aenigmarchaeota archaeon]